MPPSNFYMSAFKRYPRIVITLLVVLSTMCGFVLSNVTWRKIDFQESLLVGGYAKNLTLSVDATDMNAAKVCTMLGSFSLSCVTAAKKIHCSDVMVSLIYKAPNPDITCYTTLVEDLCMGSTVYSSLVSPLAYWRVAENLVDGINPRDTGRASTLLTILPNGEIPWFMFDLGGEYTIKNIALTSCEFLTSPTYLARSLEFRVGSSLINDGNFSTYQLVASYQGPAKPGETFDIMPVIEVKGQYVSIQKINGGYFCLSHVQIFEK